MAQTTTANNLPRKIKNLQCHNLCQNKESVSTEILETLGLNLGFGISLKPDKRTIPIDLKRLQRSVRLCFQKLPDKAEEQYIPKLHSKSEWAPPLAPQKVELALNTYIKPVTIAFNNSWKQEHIVNLEERKTALLKSIKENRKFIVIATNKNLGPVAACSGGWGNDDAANQVEPTGFGELLWSAVPINTDDPRTAY